MQVCLLKHYNLSEGMIHVLRRHGGDPNALAPRPSKYDVLSVSNEQLKNKTKT